MNEIQRTPPAPRFEDRAWLVDRRNSIQQLMLRLLARFPEENTDSPISAESWQIAVGAAFSLWRAVFLMLPETAARTIEGPLPHAKEFLQKLIDTNAIGFVDEKNASSWTVGYYLHGAASRISELMDHKVLTSFERQLARNAWDSCFDLLSDGIEHGFPRDRKT
jgi:hypothetical protein